MRKCDILDIGRILLLYLLAWFSATSIIYFIKYKGREEDKRLLISPLIVAIRFRYEFRQADRFYGRRKFLLFLDTGVIVLTILAALLYFMVAKNIVSILMRGERIPIATPIIPGLTISIELFLYLLPGLSIAIILHELGHAIASRISGVSVKSTGIIILGGLIPAAFVEPHENELRKSPLRSKLRIYSAGVFFNGIIALIVWILLSLLMSGGFYTVISDVSPGSWADKYGLEPNTIVTEIEANGTKFQELGDFIGYLTSLRRENGGTLSNLTLIVVFRTISGEEITVIKPSANDTSSGNNYERIGVSFNTVPSKLVEVGLPLNYALSIFYIVWYIFVVNLGIGAINAAPLFITDGAHVVTEVLKEKMGEKGEKIAYAISLATLLLLLPGLSLAI